MYDPLTEILALRPRTFQRTVDDTMQVRVEFLITQSIRRSKGQTVPSLTALAAVHCYCLPDYLTWDPLISNVHVLVKGCELLSEVEPLYRLMTLALSKGQAFKAYVLAERFFKVLFSGSIPKYQIGILDASFQAAANHGCSINLWSRALKCISKKPALLSIVWPCYSRSLACLPDRLLLDSMILLQKHELPLDCLSMIEMDMALKTVDSLPKGQQSHIQQLIQTAHLSKKPKTMHSVAPLPLTLTSDDELL